MGVIVAPMASTFRMSALNSQSPLAFRSSGRARASKACHVSRAPDSRPWFTACRPQVAASCTPARAAPVSARIYHGGAGTALPKRFLRRSQYQTVLTGPAITSSIGSESSLLDSESSLNNGGAGASAGASPLSSSPAAAAAAAAAATFRPRSAADGGRIPRRCFLPPPPRSPERFS